MQSVKGWDDAKGLLCDLPSVLCPGKGSGTLGDGGQRDEPQPCPDSDFPPGRTLRPTHVSKARADPMLKANGSVVYALLCHHLFILL